MERGTEPGAEDLEESDSVPVRKIRAGCQEHGENNEW